MEPLKFPPEQVQVQVLQYVCTKTCGAYGSATCVPALRVVRVHPLKDMSGESRVRKKTGEVPSHLPTPRLSSLAWNQCGLGV